MSKTSHLVSELHDIAALNEALRHQLIEAEYTLNQLFNKREKAARLANNGNWDKSQYLLDDLLQKLSDVSEDFADCLPLPSPLEKFIAA